MSNQLKNTNAFVRLLLMHGEKLGIAAIAGVAGWIVYSSLSIEGETKQPSELSQLVTQTRTKIDQFTWPDALQSDAPPPLASEFQSQVAEAVDAEIYRPSGVLDRSVVPPTILRKDPTHLPPIALEGVGVTDRIAFYSDENAKKAALEEERKRQQEERERLLAREREQRDREGGRGGRGGGDVGVGGRGYGGFGGADFEDDPNRRPLVNRVRPEGYATNGSELVRPMAMAVVTAKVPAEDQLKIYEDTFENALGYDPERDRPKYLGYVVQRAEVRPGSDELKWENIRPRSGSKRKKSLAAFIGPYFEYVVADWAGVMPSLVDSRYLHSPLTFPLPARVGRDWGPEVVHSDLPLQSETDLEEEAEEEEEDLEPVPEGDDLGNAFDDPRRGGRRGGGFDAPFGGGRGDRGAFGGGGRRGGGGFAAEGGGFGGEFGGFGDYGGGEYGGGGGGFGGGGRRGGLGGANQEFAFDVPSILLRFIDFDVRPGRSYRYRFQLLMGDPNGKGQVNLVYLDKDVKKRVAATERKSQPIVRSEWSEASPAISIPLAGAVRVASAQPSATGDRTATLIVEAFDRDAENNAIQSSIEKQRVRIGTVLNFKQKGAEIVAEERGRPYLLRVDNFNFRTGVTLLDVSGGDKLTKDLTAPASILVMDAAGRLSVRSELVDYRDVQRHRLIYAKEDRSNLGGRDGYQGEGGFDIGF